ncbi:MAG TPA: hypothetical protein VFO65_12625 [Acidimicrobiales bacterium]|nr:hypothetical protein [Acidimicrobiales bacterium]
MATRRQRTITIDRSDLDRATAGAGLGPADAERLWGSLLAGRPPAGRESFDAPHVAFYFGGMLVIGAFSWLMGQSWAQFGPGAGLAIGLGLAALFAAGSRAFLRRGWAVPGGLMATVVVMLAPLVVFAFQEATGLWPDREFGEYHDFYVWVSSSWFAMEVATVAAAAAALRLTRFPFLVAPLGLMAWFVSMDAAPLVFGQDVSAGERALVSAAVGAALLAGGLALDRRALRSHAFWAHLFGLLTVIGTLCYAAAEHGEAGWALFGMLGLAAIVASVALDRRTYSVFGGLLVAAWTSHLAYDVFGRTLLFPVVLAAIGVGIVLLGVGLARHQDRLHAQLAGWVGADR